MRFRKRRDAGEPRDPADSQRRAAPSFRVLRSKDEVEDAIQRASAKERSTLTDLVEKAQRHSRRRTSARGRDDASETG